MLWSEAISKTKKCILLENIAVSLVRSVQYTCPVVRLCIVDASLTQFVGKSSFPECSKVIKCGSFKLILIVGQA